MERIQPMNELQIQEKVEDLAGKSAKILDCEQNTLSQTEEVLLVNGIPISLVGEEGAKIKQALIHGEVPHCDLVNNMLIRAGIEKSPVELETTVNVKSSVKTLEHYQLKDSKGVLMDEKMKEKEDEDEFRTVNVEIWSLEDSMLEPEGAGNPNGVRTTIKTNSNKKEPPATTTETTGNNNKKSKFSPLSSIIKPHKSDKTQKQSKKSQQQQSQQPTNNPTENTVPSSTTTTTTTTVPKNKFLSLFSKGKSSKDNKKSNNSKLPTDQQHSAKVKDSNKTNSTTTTIPSSTEPSKANKRYNNSKNNKSSTNSSNNQDNDSLNKSAAADSKFETKKQQFNVNYLDPSKSLVHVEIDGIPVRVAYETFV